MERAWLWRIDDEIVSRVVEIKSGAPHLIRFGSLVAVMFSAKDSISDLRAGRWV